MSDQTVQRHPIRGAVAGLLFGLGLSFLLISLSVIALGTLTPIVVAVLGIVVGVAVGTLVPARGGSAPAPAAPQPGAQQPPPPAAG